MTSKKQQQLIDKLKELFQMDQADLDFGIYRIMNAKHDEIDKFLTEDLLPNIRNILQQGGKTADLKKELDDVIKACQTAGINPEESKKVQELQALLANGAVNHLEEDENEIFSQLLTFFSRYYDGGDFMSLRRYKKETFSPLPMNGEEIKLHWANADQYYVKSAENFTNYAFKVGDPGKERRVRFELVSANTEQNNVKAVAGKNRQFLLNENHPVSLREEGGEKALVIHFNYAPDAKNRAQKDINTATKSFLEQLKGTEEAMVQVENWGEWRALLLTPAPTDKNRNRTLIEKYLTDYTAKNTFDYFVHKDLGGFLRRELSFYIKNELLRLDDILPADSNGLAPQVLTNEANLNKLLAFKTIANQVIHFLDQLEGFQKKLWLKKKFVLESHYCMTLDRVSESLYPTIISNQQQLDEWQTLFTIDEIENYTTPITVDFLKANPYLPVDTAFFDMAFRYELLSEQEDLDASSNGLICHSDNYQALRLLRSKYQDKVKCIYIDPPYNTDASAIPYKNNYRHSSWGTLMRDRLEVLHDVTSEDGAIFVSIDKAERTMLEHALDFTFGQDNKVEELIWVQNTNNGRSPTYSTNHEYVEVYSKCKAAVEADFNMFREPKPGFEEVMELINKINHQYPPIDKIEFAIKKLYKDHKAELKEQAEANGLDWKTEKSNDPWKGLYNYTKAEYRDKNGKLVSHEEAKQFKARIWIWREDNISLMAAEAKQSATIRDPQHYNYRFYAPLHPLTGKPCSVPIGGWKYTRYDNPAYPHRKSFSSLDADNRISWGASENRVPQLKRMLHEVDSNVSKSVFTDYSDGEKETTAMFGRSGVFLAPKHTKFVRRFITQATNSSSYVLDCFGGSGSTGDAVIKQNREDNGQRKYMLAEMGHHFDTILKPRLLKSIYSSDWKAGKPITRDGVSHCLKYLRLESYEDALDNISLNRTLVQQQLVENNPSFRQDYTLNYMLDIESKESLLNARHFVDPFSFTLRITRDNETRTQSVDLIETFNFLLGMEVISFRKVQAIVEVIGTNPEGQRVLILWRNQQETDNDALDQWFKKQAYNTRDFEFSLIYVNGDNNLPNLRSSHEVWKVQRIEEAFHQLMFDIKDV